VSVTEPDNSSPSRTTVVNPGSENVTVYVPGRKSTMRYNPASSVTVDRTFSIKAGLAASTVTPGITAPDESRTTPVSDAWAKAVAGTRSTTISAASCFGTDRMKSP
jgi:hypothetical protein